MCVTGRAFEPWPDDEECPENVENWGWWDETPYRLKVDGPNCRGNVPTVIFDIMWERNPASRNHDEWMLFDLDDPGSDSRWLLWDEIDIAVEELNVAMRIASERGVLN